MTNKAALDALNTIIIYSKMPWNGQENMQGEFNDAVETIRTALNDAPRCKCDIRTKLVGDGCDICNPEYAAQFAPSSEGVREALIWAKTEITHHENVCGTGTKTDDIAYLRITPNMLKTLIQYAQSSMEKKL